MRPSHKNRSRSRHRSGSSGGGSTGGNPLNRVYESNGPDVKVRGTAQTVADKYLQLGRDAQSSGDIVMAESYYQYAEHYLRIVAAASAYNLQNQQHQPQQPVRRADEEFDDEDLEDTQQYPAAETRGGQLSQGGDVEGSGDQPVIPPDGDRNQQQPQQAGRQQRDQSNQSRDRSRSRWQDRRDQPQQGGENRSNAQPSRHDEQPRVVETTATIAPAAAPDEGDGNWEAPSFLRRPAAVPVAETASVEESVPEADPAPAPAKRAYTRKPRKAAAPEAAGAVEPPVIEPAAD